VARRFLDRLGVRARPSNKKKHWEERLFSSGDFNSSADRPLGEARGFFHRGPSGICRLFDGLAAPMAAGDRADSGLLPDSTTIQSRRRGITRTSLRECAARTLPMICANPTWCRSRDKLVYCAGSDRRSLLAAGAELSKTRASLINRPIVRAGALSCRCRSRQPVKHHRLTCHRRSVAHRPQVLAGIAASTPCFRDGRHSRR